MPLQDTTRPMSYCDTKASSSPSGTSVWTAMGEPGQMPRNEIGGSGAQRARQLEVHVLDRDRDFLDGHGKALAAGGDRFLHEKLGRGRPGGDAEALHAFHPTPVDVGGALHEPGARAARRP